MTSKIVVNNIEADAGVSTVTFNSNVERGSSRVYIEFNRIKCNHDTLVHVNFQALLCWFNSWNSNCKEFNLLW